MCATVSERGADCPAATARAIASAEESPPPLQAISVGSPGPFRDEPGEVSRRHWAATARTVGSRREGRVKPPRLTGGSPGGVNS